MAQSARILPCPPERARQKALDRLFAILAEYPRPVRPSAATGESRRSGVPPVRAALAIYAKYLHRTPEDELATAAFAAVVPAVLGRCQQHRSAALSAIADGRRAPPTARLSILADLSGLATALAPAPPDAAASGPYIAVCDAIAGLHELGQGM